MENVIFFDPFNRRGIGYDHWRWELFRVLGYTQEEINWESLVGSWYGPKSKGRSDG
jgi:hypothetical protein